VPLHHDNARAIRVAAIGHRVIAPEVRARVASTVERVLFNIRAGVDAIPQRPPAPVKLVVVSPMAQGADQLIAKSAIAAGYRLAAVLPAAQADYERTFDVDTEDDDIATLRDLIAKAHPPAGEGCLVLDGDMSSEEGRDRAFLACADAVILGADMVMAILSNDRWQSQSGQTARDALARGIPVIVISPEMPDQAILLVHQCPEEDASDSAIRKIVGLQIERKFPNPIAKARSLLAAGDCLAAVDFLRNLSDEAAADRPAERNYLLVLALARTGASRLALETFRSRLAPLALGELPLALARDIGALEARCLKDIGLETANREALLTAARAYENVYQRFGGYYPLINAATLTLLGGESDRAHSLARQTLTEAVDADYWSQVSRAEALLILEDIAGASKILDAASTAPVPPSDLATTKKQLLRVCAANGLPTSLLGSMHMPAVLYYSGRDASENGSGGLNASAISQLRRLDAGFAYGSLANTGDILIAEALLDMGVELNLVLPYRADEFARASIPAGWSSRFNSCINRATSLSYVLDNDILHHACVLAMSARQAMGLARYRAEKLASTVLCLSNQDRAVELIAEPAITQDAAADGAIVPRCLLFADVKGFSKLPERNMDVFVRSFLGAQAEAIRDFGSDIDFRATAGDGIFLVFRTPLLAAKCGLAMQQRACEFDRRRFGIEADLQLRIAIHYGPVHPVHDPILDAPSFAGREIIRAARMEPITPPGEIFVTEQLASALFLAGAANYRCDYVGILPSAKSFGSFRMYSIKAMSDESTLMA
jgi:class 3 adenylate cyclase